MFKEVDHSSHIILIPFFFEMGILGKIKGWLFRTSSLPIAPSVGDSSPVPSPKVEIEPSSSSPIAPLVSEVGPQRVIEENKEQDSKVEKPIQTLEVTHEEQLYNDTAQPIVNQNENTPSQDIPVMPELTQSDPILPLVTQPENISSQIIPTNQNDSIQPLAIQPESTQSENVQLVQHEDTLFQNIQPAQPESKAKRSRRTRSNNSTRSRSRKKLKESADPGT